jgi:tetratricopeptide (TPR) repeat protein
MRKLNVRLLVVLIGFNLVLGVSLFALHYFQSGRIAKALLWQARHAEEENNLPRTVEYLKRYLDFAPEDTEERSHFCTLLAGEKFATLERREQALFNMERVLREQPERDDIRRLLVRVAMELRRFDIAREQLDRLVQKYPKDGEVARLFGQWHDSQGHEREAAEWYEKSIQFAPQQIDCYVRLAEILRHPSDPSQQEQAQGAGERVLDRLVANNPESYRAYLARARYRLATVAPAEARERNAADIARALELAPDEPDVLLMAIAQAQQDKAKARQYLARGLKAHPDSARMYQAESRLELQANRPDLAIAALERGISASKGEDRLALQFDLTGLLIDHNQMAKTTAVLADLRRANLDRGRLDLLTGRIAVAKGHWPEAVRSLERALPFLAGFPALLDQADQYLAGSYEQLDEPDKVINAYARIVLRNPASIAARLRLANAQAAAGRYEDALTEYRQIVLLPGAPASVWTEIARLSILRAQRTDVRRWDQVTEAIRKAEAADPNSVEIPLLLTEAYLAQERAQAARAVLEKAIDRFPKSVRIWAALINVLDHDGQDQAARQSIEKANTLLDDLPEWRLVQIRYWGGHPGPEAEKALTRLESQIDHFSDPGRGSIEQALATAYFRLGRRQETSRLFNRLLARPAYRSDLRLRRQAFELMLQAGDEPGMEKMLAEIRDIEGGEGPFWLYGEATRLIWLGRSKRDPAKLEQAHTLLDRLSAQRPRWSAVLVAKGEIEDVSDHPDQAIANYQAALALGDRNPRLIHRLVQLLYEHKRYDELDSEMRRLQQQGLLPADLQRVAADIALGRQDFSRAVELARQSVAMDSKNYRDLIWLGQILAAGGRNDEAEECFRRALKLAGNVPDPWLALARQLSRTNRSDEAASLLKQMADNVPADQRALALAQGYEILGRVKDAEAEYARLLKARPQDMTVQKSAALFYLRRNNPGSAEPLLRRLRDNRSDKEEAGWASRNLALVLAGRPGYANFLEALALCGLKLSDDGTAAPLESKAAATPEELRVRARVLATAPRRVTRAEAIKLLEKLQQTAGLDDENRLLLAQLEDADGSWAKARDILRHFIATPGGSPAALVASIRSYLRHNELEPAQELIDRLERREKEQKTGVGALGSVELRALLLEARGELSQAIDLLRTRAEDKQARPSEILSYAELLSRHGRLAQALSVVETAWRTCPAQLVSGACLAVILAGQPQPADLAKVEQWLRAAFEKEPRSLVFGVHLANILELAGKYAEAETMYRRILGQDGTNLLALNNLAWLMAQRGENLAEALALINRAIDHHGARADLLDTRAMVYLMAKQPAAAISDLNQVIQDSPSASRYIHLARAYDAAGNRSAAREAIAQAKAAGLDLTRLHPLEREACRGLLAELAKG